MKFSRTGVAVEEARYRRSRPGQGCSFTVGSDYGDPEMAKLSGSTQEECCEACSNAPGECKVAVFDTTTGNCSMKTSANQPRQTQKFVACTPR